MPLSSLSSKDEIDDRFLFLFFDDDESWDDVGDDFLPLPFGFGFDFAVIAVVAAAAFAFAVAIIFFSAISAAFFGVGCDRLLPFAPVSLLSGLS